MDNSTAKKLIWLASYPKSGNTWLRAFITALTGEEININELGSDGIFSSRLIFDKRTGLDSSLLFDKEAKVLQGGVYSNMARETKKETLFIKVHDAFTITSDGKPLIATEGTFCAIYIIRNPLDMAASLANHNDSTIDEAICLLNNDNGQLSGQNDKENTKPQFEQNLMNWSLHVASWTTNMPFPVLVLRYEDMLSDTFNFFSNAVQFMSIEANAAQIRNAIEASSFERLQQSEKESGFNERKNSNFFFRNGKAGNWKTELNAQQISSVLNKHKQTMKKYGYFTE